MDNGSELPLPRGEDELRFGEWHARRSTGELIGPPGEQRLEPKIVELLWLLASHAPAVVSREALFARLWPGVIVTDDALARAVSKLRKALGDGAGRSSHIETVPKRGYRWVAEAEFGPGARASALTPHAVASPAGAIERVRVRLPIAWLLAASLTAVASVGTVYSLRARAEAAPHRLVSRADDFYAQYQRTDNEAAITLYERLLVEHPGYAPAYAGLANALVQRAVRWPQAGPGEPAREYTRLRDALASGHLRRPAGEQMLARAELYATRAVELSPRDAGALKALGFVRSAQGDFDAALDVYRRALASDRDAWGVLINIADVLEITGRDAEALLPLEAAYAAMGRAYEAQAARVRPWRTKLGIAIGERHENRGDVERAERFYRAVLDEAPLDPDATERLATLLERRGDAAAAHELRRQRAARLGGSG